MKKVLIVEDHPDIREMLRTQLDLLGYNAVTAKDGKEAVEKAIAEKPDLILMDIMLPETDGLEATRRLRVTLETKDIPILATTATFRPQDLQACIQAGCNDYIVKPFTMDELLKKIKGLIR